MLPANSGVNGWQLVILSTQLLYPRNDPKDPLKAYSYLTKSDVVYSVVYRLNNIQLWDNNNAIVVQIPVMNVINVDLSFDQLDRYVLVWECPGDLIYMNWYDPNLAARTTTQVATGNNPCCMIDERRDKLIPNSDVFIFYQRGDHVYYRLQRDRYLVEYEIPHTHTDVELETCGMGTNLRMTIRTSSSDALLVMAGDRPVGVDNSYVGLPYGVIPWETN